MFFSNHALIPNTLPGHLKVEKQVLPGHLKVEKQVFHYGALVFLADIYRCLRGTCCLCVGLKWLIQEIV